MLAPMLEAETGLPVAGFLPPVPEAAIGSRHLGLYTAGEVADLQQKIALLAQAAEENIHWEKLLSLCEQPAPAAAQIKQEHKKQCVKIAVARDEAFCFAYAETLEALTAAGAEPVPFSPVRDPALPEGVGGLYLPGGYPELHAQALSENTSMRQSIRGAVAAGLPTVAECGGFLYLGQTLEDAEGGIWPMAGVLPGQGVKVGRLVRFGYATLTARADSLLFRAGEQFPVHEFHHWDSTENGTALTAAKANGRQWACGFANEHFYAGFPHLYWAGTPLPERFVAAAESYQNKRGEFMTEATLKTLLEGITPPDEAARAAAHAHWASLAKPLGGLGALETTLESAAALTGSAALDLSSVPSWSSARTTAWWRRASARRTRA